MEKTRTKKGCIVYEDNAKTMNIRKRGSKWREVKQSGNEEMKAKEENNQKTRH
jgi:hypothetical protein